MMTTAFGDPGRRRPAGLALTMLVHAALFAGWQMSRHAPPAPGPEPVRTRIQWIRLAPPAPLAPAPVSASAPAPARPAMRPAAVAARPVIVPGLPASMPALAPAPAASDTTPLKDDAAQPAAPSEPVAPPATDTILQRAKRDAGAIDRALRKENNPYIVAPLDSPQIRMRNKMQAAHDAVTPGVGEAPAIDELRDASGAPVTRVRGALGTYCMTARSPAEGIDAFEKRGGLRRTGCPAPSSQGGSRGWRTARD
jgi:hypothetical protein